MAEQIELVFFARWLLSTYPAVYYNEIQVSTLPSGSLS